MTSDYFLIDVLVDAKQDDRDIKKLFIFYSM
jgi:hypothetical protein